MQLAIVILILAAAVGYAARRIVRTMRHTDNPCDGCSGCELKNMKKRGCEQKK